MQSKNVFLALAMAAAFVSCGASATGWGHHDDNGKNHATKGELKAEAGIRADADKNLQGQITKNVNTQNGVNNQVQGQIKAVDQKANTAQQTATGAQQAAQIANEKADAGAVRADGIEQRATVTDNRSINNAVRLDGAEAGIRETNGAVKAVRGDIATINDVNAAQQTQINTSTTTNIRQDGQIQDLQNYATDMDQRLGGRLDSQQSQINKNSRDIKEAKNMAAAALAVAGQQFCTGQECGFQAAVSAATIGGAQALAIGVGGAVSENVFLNAALTSSSSVTGGVVSGTYRFK